MARTQRYVTRTAGGGGSGTSGSPWTLDEAITNAAAGDDINILDDGTAYTLTASKTIANAGTTANPIRWRGYASSVGDWWQGLDSTGFLATTNFPVLSFNSTYRFIATAAANIFEGIEFSGSVSNSLVAAGAAGVSFIGCKSTNSSTNASARAFGATNHTTTRFLLCDGFQTGASGGAAAFYFNINGSAYGCRGKSVSGAAFQFDYGFGMPTLDHCVGYDSVTGLSVTSTAAGAFGRVSRCTFVGNSGDGVDVASGWVGGLLLEHCMMTDNGAYGVDGNGCTGTIHDFGCRYRDNTSGNSNIPADNDALAFDRITTDGGGAESDYKDDASSDWRLVRQSPGHNWNVVRGLSRGACDVYAPLGLVGHASA